MEVPLPSSSMMTSDLPVAEARMSLVSESSCSQMHEQGLDPLPPILSRLLNIQYVLSRAHRRRRGHIASVFLDRNACAEVRPALNDSR